MKNVTRHTGTLQIIDRLQSSANGNPRYLCRVDGYTFRTQVDHQHGYSIRNFERQRVTVTIGTHYGKLTLDTIRKAPDPEYLLLASGDARGFKKARIPAPKAQGLCGHVFPGETELRAPCHDAIRAALPQRWRAAWDRANGALWFNKNNDQFPAYVCLRNARGKYITTLYLQPLTKGADQ